MTFRLVARGLLRSPSFSTSAALTLALGLSLTTIVFVVIDAVLLKPLPYRDADRLVALGYRYADPQTPATGVPSPVLDAWREQSHTFDAWSAYSSAPQTLVEPSGEQVQLTAYWMSAAAFPILSVDPPAVGRNLEPADESANADAVVVLSHRFWSATFGADPTMIGRTLAIGGRRYLVVGVASPTLQFPALPDPDVFLPMPPVPPTVVRFDRVLARLAPSVSLTRARAELQAIDRRARASYPAAMAHVIAAGGQPDAVSLRAFLTGATTPALLVAAGAVGLVLLLACANVGGLLLVRNAARLDDLAIRTALGATRGDLFRDLVTECLLLSVTAGVGALAVVAVVSPVLRRVIAAIVPHGAARVIDWRAFGFLSAIVVGVAVMAAAAPATVLGRRSLADRLRRGSRGATESGGRRSGQFLTGVQGAIASLLLTIALLLFMNVRALTSSRSLGFSAREALTFKLPSQHLGRDPRAVAVTLGAVLDALQRRPDVDAVGATTALPLSANEFGFVVSLAGRPMPDAATPATSVDLASPDYFKALGIAIASGRPFDVADTSTSAPVAIVNRAFVRAYLADTDPLRAKLSLGGPPDTADIAIVGVADDVRDGALGQPVAPKVYRPFTQAFPQMGWHTAAVAMKIRRAPVSVIDDIRSAVLAVAPEATTYDFQTMAERLGRSVAPESARAAVMGLAASSALLLAVVGLYGFLAFIIGRSRREIAIRLALGASARRVAAAVVARGLAPTAVGLCVGLLAADGIARGLGAVLVTVSPFRVGPYAGSAAIVLVAALAASVGPLRRARRVDPLRLLREE